MQKDYFTLFSISSFPNSEKKASYLEAIKFESSHLLKQKNIIRVTQTVLEILKGFNALETTNVTTKKAIEKLITECALTEDGSLNMKPFEIQNLESSIFIGMNNDANNPIRTTLLPAYKKLKETSEKKLYSMP